MSFIKGEGVCRRVQAVEGRPTPGQSMLEVLFYLTPPLSFYSPSILPPASLVRLTC